MVRGGDKMQMFPDTFSPFWYMFLGLCMTAIAAVVVGPSQSSAIAGALILPFWVTLNF